MLNRHLVPAFLNLFTLVGGHLYNKRYDQMVVFTTILVFWYMVSWYLIRFLTTALIGKSFDPGQIENLNMYYVAQSIGFLLLFVVSAVIGYANSKNADRQRTKITRWVTTVSGVLLSGYAAYLIVFQVIYFVNIDFGASGSVIETKNGKISSSTRSRLISTDKFFFNGTAFKRYDSAFRDESLPDPPGGNGSLVGAFYLDGKTIPHLTFDIVLDGKYRAKQVTTGDDGQFAIPIQTGTWHVDYVHITAWDEKPADRDLKFVTGRENKLRATNYYDRGLYDLNQGLPVQVSPGNQQPAILKFILRDKISIISPEADGEKQKVTTESFLVRWQQYPDAKHYLLQINQVTRNGNTTSYQPAAIKKVTDATQFALADLKTVAHEGAPLEYQVQVYAFDKENNYLSESDSFPRHSLFLLSDGRKIIDKDAENVFGEPAPYSVKETEVMYNNKKRLDAVKLLIQEKLFPEAEALLKKVQGKTTPGEKEAIIGYLLAEQNRCEEAEKYFEKAKKASTSDCMPECYQKNCVK